MDLGQAIKTMRKKKGASQKQTAAKAGISANALCSIEKNEAWPSKSTIYAICEALGIPVSCLLFASITDEDVPEPRSLQRLEASDTGSIFINS